MVQFLAIFAAIGVAIFNGIAAILEKVGADRHKIVTSSHPVLLWNLKKSIPYLIGIVLDLFAWVFTLIAVHRLPLFLVQPIIACSIIVTVAVENYLLKRRPNIKFMLSIVS
jgi:drug/metabolite transporter (DMT)-like permease